MKYPNGLRFYKGKQYVCCSVPTIKNKTQSAYLIQLNEKELILIQTNYMPIVYNGSLKNMFAGWDLPIVE